MNNFPDLSTLKEVTEDAPAEQLDATPASQEPATTEHTEEHTATSQTEEAASAAATDTQPEAQSAVETNNENFTSEEVNGLVEQFTKSEFKDPQSLMTELTRLRAIEQQKADPLEGLSDFSKNLIQWEKAGLDPGQFAQMQSLDFQKMDAKQIFKQEYLKENASSAKKDPDRANRMAEFKFKQAYGNLFDQTLDESSDEYQSLKDLLDEETDAKREKLIGWQKQNSVPPQKTQEGPTPENKEFTLNHLKKVDEKFSTVKHLEIPVSDKPEDVFKYVPTPEALKAAKSWVADPSQFFKENFLDSKGDFDYESMQLKALVVADLKSYNEKLIAHGIAIGREKLLVESRKNPSKPNLQTHGQQNKIKSETEQLVDQYFK